MKNHTNSNTLLEKGSSHWILQRVTALILIPFFIYFVSCVFYKMRYIIENPIHSFNLNPLTLTLIIVFIITLFYHATLGLTVIIEDYVHIAWYADDIIICNKASKSYHSNRFNTHINQNICVDVYNIDRLESIDHIIGDGIFKTIQT